MDEKKYYKDLFNELYLDELYSLHKSNYFTSKERSKILKSLKGTITSKGIMSLAPTIVGLGVAFAINNEICKVIQEELKKQKI